MNCRSGQDTLEDRVARSMERVRSDLTAQVLALTAEFDDAQAEYEAAFDRENRTWERREGGPKWQEAMEAVDLAYGRLQQLRGRAREIERRMHRLSGRGEFDRRLEAARRLEDLRARKAQEAHA